MRWQVIYQWLCWVQPAASGTEMFIFLLSTRQAFFMVSLKENLYGYEVSNEKKQITAKNMIQKIPERIVHF